MADSETRERFLSRHIQHELDHARAHGDQLVDLAGLTHSECECLLALLRSDSEGSDYGDGDRKDLDNRERVEENISTSEDAPSAPTVAAHPEPRLELADECFETGAKLLRMAELHGGDPGVLPSKTIEEIGNLLQNAHGWFTAPAPSEPVAWRWAARETPDVWILDHRDPSEHVVSPERLLIQPLYTSPPPTPDSGETWTGEGWANGSDLLRLSENEPRNLYLREGPSESYKNHVRVTVVRLPSTHTEEADG